MNILITYSSKTGNTKKVAEAVKAGIPTAELIPVSEVQNTENYDLIIIGGWIDRANFDAAALKFVQSVKNKNVAYFFTLGAYPDSDHAKDCVKNIEKSLIENSNKILGKFFCQGAVDPKLISFIEKLPADHIMAVNEERRKRWKDASTHPDNNDLENAKAFGQSLINIK